MPLFRDRADAGRQLATHLVDFAGRTDVIVLALPRGGVPVGYQVARALNAPLDVYLVRKLGLPGHEELAMGAVASDGSYVIDENIVHAARVSTQEFEAELAQEFAELQRRKSAYRDDLPEPHLAGKMVIVVDDGLATGASMYAAVSALRHRNPAEIIVAVPVAAPATSRSLEQVVDRFICPNRPYYFGAVGLYYEDFEQVTDEEVRRLLREAASMQKTWKAA
jgi:putative phosphoribosyl transferase